MAYNDELGAILDKLSGEELKDLAIEILKLDSATILKLKNTYKLKELKRICSCELRAAGGHTLCNLWRDDHDLPYIEIVRDVANKMKVAYNSNHDVLIIERMLIDEQVRKLWSKADDVKKIEITNLAKQQAVSMGKNAIAQKITVDSMQKVISEGVTQRAVLSIFGVSSVTNTVGSVLGYNVIQTILLQAIYRNFGLWTAGEAVLGIGSAGLAINIARFAGPIGLGITTLYTVHQIAGPAFRKTVPAVFYIAHKRMEKFEIS